MDVARAPTQTLEHAPLAFRTGMIVATLFAAWLGLMALALANVASAANADVNSALRLNPGIGPYSGKELVWLATWFLSWPVLHFAIRNKDLDLKRWFGVFLVLLFTAVLLMWPPVFEAIAERFQG